jgi:hypothetical protein
MISPKTLLLQALGSALIALFTVWSTYRDNKYAIPSNLWLNSLSRLPNKLRMGIQAFLAFGAMFLIGDLIWFVEPSIHKLYFYALAKIGLQGTEVGVGVLVIFFGLVAYLFKVGNPRLYGLIEILVAGGLGVAAAKQLSQPSPLIGEWTALIGAIYVVSRGIGNIADGLKPKQENRI